MTITRSASRSFAGRFVPLAGTVAAGIFILFAWSHANSPRWIGMDPRERIFAAGMGIFMAVGIEMFVLRQLALVNSGVVTEAIIDEVRTVDWAREQATAHYHFFTEDGRVISARCVIGDDENDHWATGRHVTVIYDPTRPARHAVEDRIWGVQWHVATA